MNVSLTPELDQLVQQKVASGLYQTASEVIREGLRLLHERDAMREQQIRSLRQKIDRGLKQLDAGQSVSAEKAWKQIQSRRKHASHG
jgi:antitoxin ParD1/3/4